MTRRTKLRLALVGYPTFTTVVVWFAQPSLSPFALTAIFWLAFVLCVAVIYTPETLP